MDGWNTTFLLGRPIFRGYVSFREGNSFVSFSGGGPLSLKGVVFMKNHGINGEDSNGEDLCS